MVLLYLYIALGGALGAVGRYALAGWVHSAFGTQFPWGTLAVNVIGSAALGFALGLLRDVPASVEARAFLTIGFLGAFTTFSTFSFEAVALLRDGEWGPAALYVGGSVGAGLLFMALGLVIAQMALEVLR